MKLHDQLLEAIQKYIVLLDESEKSAASACEKICDEHAMEFAEWAVNQKWDMVMLPGYNDDGTPKTKTTSELLELFKKETGK